MALLAVLVGGEAGLRCGEMMALEWTDIDFAKRNLTVARSEWKGLGDFMKSNLPPLLQLVAERMPS